MADGIVRTGSHTNQMNHIKIKQNLHGKNSSGAQQNGTESLFICAHPVTPNMVNFRDRVRTFIKWPKTITKATAVQIAKAGFFFLGDRDRTKCFYCNGGLQNWEYNDEPWSEHAKWFPNCEFVLQQKGIQFVQEITTKFPNLKRPNMPGQQILPNVCPPIHSNTQQLNKVQTLSQVLESDVVKMATSFGFDDDLVRQVIEQTLHEERRLPDSVMELVTAF
uniref:Uncharacterized protein n=1 Tax=Ciona savignyi TaxID=51511 RepID=H2ZM65_CIOSA